ncbi:hypothetical protein T10_228 [Trichinella papuae]|uniref:Uncharacterized protein n=1 Tax=Trichinella papuae TaxID=268474 RepID=A0A0V1MZ64_9BILA|nr:hypothetical protein T10_228 [Trichinella papuae]
MTSRRRSTATTKLSRRARKRDAQDERINLEINGEDEDHCTSAKQSCQAFHWCQLFEALVFCLNRKQIDRSLLIEKEGPLRLLGLLGQWESITTTTTKALYINLFTHCCVFTDVRNRLNPACDISRSPSVVEN